MNTRETVNAQPAPTPTPGRMLQRKCACGGAPGIDGECDRCRDKRLSLKRDPATPGAAEQTLPPLVPEVLGSPGQPLDLPTRSFMESRFGHDFSQVRVHRDARAAESAQSVSALAYTVGRDVVFGVGQYSPHTNTGQRLIAHELAHVVQQQAGTAGPRGETIDEAEADRAAELIGRGESPEALGLSAPALRRQGAGASSGGSSSPLAQLTHLHFSLGPARFEIDLPTSVAITLPVQLRGRQTIEFRLSADVPERFEFSATYDGIRDVQIYARAVITTSEGGLLSGGIGVRATEMICRPSDPDRTRSSLRTAGEQLRDAINAVQAAPTAREGEGPLEVAQRWGAVGSAIAGVHEAIENAKRSCVRVPRFSVELGGRAPLAPFSPALPPTGHDLERAPYVGATATFYF